MKRIKEKQLIGRTDFVSIPDADIFNLPCKIDTGADTSSIHCERVRIKEINGEDHLVFKLLDKKHKLYSGKELMIKEFKETKVKSSFGDYEFRYQVKLPIILFDKNFNVSFNLSNRKRMKFAVLLGRRFLSNRFIVDVSKSDLSLENENSSTLSE